MRGKSAALLSQGRVSPWWIRQPQEATTMAKAQRARAAMIASYPKVFHSVIEVDEHTAVPKDAACAPADLANEFDLEGRLVVCVKFLGDGTGQGICWRVLPTTTMLAQASAAQVSIV
jgi:hypothetical protein